MDPNLPSTPHRPLRWYEWLLLAVLLGLIGGVRAAPVYKCTQADGAVAYQDQPCVEAARAETLVLPSAPPLAASPRYAVQEADSSGRRGEVVRPPSGTAHAFECRTADGARFYRFGGCPATMPDAGAPSGHRGRGGSRVSARRVPLATACAEIHRAGAIGRRGHEHDEVVSSYEHNLGHDPCR
jgi:hypothetical protein